MVDEKDRDAYEAGRREADYISENSLSYALSGGIESRPSEPSQAEAFQKGLERKQLDE